MTSSRNEQPGFLSVPQLTRAGIVCTNSFGSALYRLDGSTVVEIASGPGVGLYYTISPDGARVGFKRITDEGLQVPSILDPATGKSESLTAPVRQAGQVSFTDDGRMAFTIGSEMVVTDGVIEHRYDLGLYANIAPISPDGSIVAYNDADDQIWVLSLQSGKREKISVPGRGYFSPLWSPDGARLVFRGLSGTMHVYDRTPGNVIDIGQGDHPAWMSDSRSLLFYRTTIENGRLVESDLFTIRADGTEERQLTRTAGILEMDPAPAGDGTSILCQTHALNQLLTVPMATGPSLAKAAPSVLANGKGLSIVPRFPPAVQQPDVILDIPYVHQVYDTPDWFNGHWACAPTQAIMLLAYYNVLPPWTIVCSWPSRHPTSWGNYVADRYRFRQVEYSFLADDPNQSPAMGGYGYMWTGTSSPHSRMASYFRNHGLTATQTESTPYSTAAAEVGGGYPFSMCVMLTDAGHLVLAHGFGAEPHTFVFNDPYGNKNLGYMNTAGKNVLYDWPGFNNGYQNLTGVAWCIATRSVAPAVSDSIVDDLQFGNGFTLATASPASMGRWRDLTRGYQGHLWYTYTQTGVADTCFAEWRPALQAAGAYAVDAFIPLSNATHAVYRIVHAEGSDTVVIDQSPYREAWVPLGIYSFDAGNSGHVYLGDASTVAGQEIVFDALRWSRVVTAMSGDMVSFTPARWVLHQNYPNPFNPGTTILYTVGRTDERAGTERGGRSVGDGVVRLGVYDVLGREVAVLVDGVVSPGEHSVVFDAGGLAGGVYFYRLQTPAGSLVRTMLFAK